MNTEHSFLRDEELWRMRRMLSAEAFSLLKLPFSLGKPLEICGMSFEVA